MFYEGTEKRLEITLKEKDLLLFSDAFWSEMVEQADAYILSKIENSEIKAYLLSESSLFVWKNKLLLITCGNTHLVRAAQFFQKHVSKEKIQSLLFHRHHPHHQHLQKSNFAQDSSLLKSQLQGVTQHWQGKYQGDLFLFGESLTEAVTTKQIVMFHGLSGGFSDSLQNGTASLAVIESQLAVLHFFPQLSIDQFVFTPKGFSLNAITAEQYLTIHITPEKLSTYLSIESSFESQLMSSFITHLRALFQPEKVNSMDFSYQLHKSFEINLS
ncbi:MAG: S-adenosylmethionine decarboxylase [Psychromonas sp.]